MLCSEQTQTYQIHITFVAGGNFLYINLNQVRLVSYLRGLLAAGGGGEIVSVAGAGGLLGLDHGLKRQK